MPRVLGRLEKNLSSWNSKYCRENDETVFHIEHTVTYSVFLYLLSNQLYKEGFEQSAAYVYYLNKIMHSVDWFYAIELPDYFGRSIRFPAFWEERSIVITFLFTRV